MRRDCVISARQEPHDPLHVAWVMGIFARKLTKIPGPNMPRTSCFDEAMTSIMSPRVYSVPWMLRTSTKPQRACIYLQTVLAEFGEATRFGNDTTAEWLHRIKDICHDIQQNPGHAWSVADLAASHHCNVDHFTRMFKIHVGESPSHYTIRCRIDRARKLLLVKSLSISQIAFELGYSDASYFSKQFKKITGQSPRSYQKSQIGGIATAREVPWLTLNENNE